MPRLRLGPENKSLQKLTGLFSLLKFFLYSLQIVSTTKTQNKVNFLKLYALKRACPTAIGPIDLVLIRFGRHYA